MRRKNRTSKSKFIALFLPFIFLILVTATYGTLEDRITLIFNLGTAHKPEITMNGILLNAQNNVVAIFVNDTSGIIENTDPIVIQAQINITNINTSPIDKIVLNMTLPNDWKWTGQLSLQLCHDEGADEIDVMSTLIIYDEVANTLKITVPTFKTASSLPLNQNESLIISFNIEYLLKGQVLLPEYENDLSVYAINATATAWIGGWGSAPKSTNIEFATYIYRI